MRRIIVILPLMILVLLAELASSVLVYEDINYSTEHHSEADSLEDCKSYVISSTQNMQTSKVAVNTNHLSVVVLSILKEICTKPNEVTPFRLFLRFRKIII